MEWSGGGEGGKERESMRIIIYSVINNSPPLVQWLNLNDDVLFEIVSRSDVVTRVCIALTCRQLSQVRERVRKHFTNPHQGSYNLWECLARHADQPLLDWALSYFAMGHKNVDDGGDYYYIPRIAESYIDLALLAGNIPTAEWFCGHGELLPDRYDRLFDHRNFSGMTWLYNHGRTPTEDFLLFPGLKQDIAGMAWLDGKDILPAGARQTNYQRTWTNYRNHRGLTTTNDTIICPECGLPLRNKHVTTLTIPPK